MAFDTLLWLSHAVLITLHEFLLTVSGLPFNFLIIFSRLSHEFLIKFSWLFISFFKEFCAFHTISHNFLMTFSQFYCVFLINFTWLSKVSQSVSKWVHMVDTRSVKTPLIQIRGRTKTYHNFQNIISEWPFQWLSNEKAKPNSQARCLELWNTHASDQW